MKVDRIELHERLWQDADRLKRVTIHQKQLSEEYGVTHATMNIAVRDLEKQGRIRKVAAKMRNVGIYVVRDPAAFEHEFEGVLTPGVGVLRCKKCGELEKIGKHIVGAYRAIVP